MPVTGALADTLTYNKVRALLGVDTVTLPDTTIEGLPLDLVLQAANRRVPQWSALTPTQKASDFDLGVTFALAAECVEPLKTLYAPGEGTGDAKGGQYDWAKREPVLRKRSQAYFDRAATLLNSPSTPTPVYKPFQPYGRSKQDGFVSADTFKFVPVINPLEQLKP